MDLTSSSGAVGSVEQLFFQNLMLMGFSPRKNEQVHHIRFYPEMFKNPNPKGMEVIFHFLLSNLDAKRVERDFRHAWPVLSKTQTHAFRTLVFNWLQELEKQGLLMANCVRQSLLQSCHGERFNLLLWQCSNVVLHTMLQRDFAAEHRVHVPPDSIFQFHNRQYHRPRDIEMAKNVIMVCKIFARDWDELPFFFHLFLERT